MYLQVKLVPSIAASTDEAFSLYRRYQIAVHKDPPEKLTRKSFENFLTRSPLQVIVIQIISINMMFFFFFAFSLFLSISTFNDTFRSIRAVFID